MTLKSAQTSLTMTRHFNTRFQSVIKFYIADLTPSPNCPLLTAALSSQWCGSHGAASAAVEQIDRTFTLCVSLYPPHPSSPTPCRALAFSPTLHKNTTGVLPHRVMTVRPAALHLPCILSAVPPPECSLHLFYKGFIVSIEWVPLNIIFLIYLWKCRRLDSH